MEIRRDVFQAIADPTRRDILNLVANKRLNLNAIADNFTVSRPAISQHIKILTECGLIVILQKGRERYCIVQPEKLSAVADWIEPFRKLWENRFDELDNLLTNLKTKKKKGNHGK
ncbi:MAG: metalloregulator ArsR/SmtB family transcription factor [Chitinophagales bacterium]